MKIEYSNVHGEVRKELEHESQHHIQKLGRLLKKYPPDSIHFHGRLEKTTRKSEFELSLNLILPTGTLHATGTGSDPRASAKMAFTEIEVQVKKHQEKLRKDYVWKRKRVGVALKAYEVSAT
jgi:ribosome-associated translation inhibitor RaiA